MKIVFFGTPEFAAEILAFLIHKGVNIVAVVTREDKPKGRGLSLECPLVKKVAQTLLPHVPILQPKRASSPEFIETLAAFQADLFVVVAYGQILKQNLLDLPPLGCINTHASLLPKYRGAAPIQRCIMNGETETGVTIMQMALEMDAGDMLRQDVIQIPPDMTYGVLQQKLCELSQVALMHVLHDIEAKNIHPVVQNHAAATYAPKVELLDTEIHWNRPAIQINNLIRGVNPEPGAWCTITIRGVPKKLKIYSSRIIADQSGKPGQILTFGKQGVIIACLEGALQLIDIQLEGKKRISAEAFACGYFLIDVLFTIS